MRERLRILSLDGGGVQGACRAAVRAVLERLAGRRLVECFDLITGTSTGGIIALAAVLGRRTRGEARCRLGVPSYDAVRGEAHVFRPAHTAGPPAATLPAVEVALAPAAAPTYGPAWTVDRGCHLDGGLWANCPVTVGLVEAIGVLGQAPNAMDVLRIGTATEPCAVSPRRRQQGGLLRWNIGLRDLLQQAQVAAALA